MTSAGGLTLEGAVSLLAVGSTEEDFSYLRSICAGAGWTLYEARGPEQARAQMVENGIAVVLCQYDLADGHWTELLDAASAPLSPPYLIVWARHADERLWAEVLNLGGYGVLAVPFQAPEVVETVNAAITKWRARGVVLETRKKGAAREAPFRSDKQSVA
jgi:DNA-binding NtrC family response regulator